MTNLLSLKKGNQIHVYDIKAQTKESFEQVSVFPAILKRCFQKEEEENIHLIDLQELLDLEDKMTKVEIKQIQTLIQQYLSQTVIAYVGNFPCDIVDENLEILESMAIKKEEWVSFFQRNMKVTEIVLSTELDELWYLKEEQYQKAKRRRENEEKR